MLQAPSGVPSARQLVSHALVRWRQRMLRADNTSVIVITLLEHGNPLDTVHREEVLIDLGKVSQGSPTSISRADTPLLQVSKCRKTNVDTIFFFAQKACMASVHVLYFLQM